MTKYNTDSLTNAEAAILAGCMEENRYNQSKVSKILGISRTALRQKLLSSFGNKYVGGASGYDYINKK